MADFTGTTGNDRIIGTSGDDTIDISQGGVDTVQAGAGDDQISVGGALTADDRIDGGDGDDILYLDGDYSKGLVFTNKTATNFEAMQVAGGHDYDLTLASGLTAASSEFDFQAGNLLAGDTLRVDASAFGAGQAFSTAIFDSNATLIGGAGGDVVGVSGKGEIDFSGGGGDDSLSFAFRTMRRTDHFDGGAGNDTLFLQDGGSEVFTGKMLTSVETIILFSGSYNLKMGDTALAGGQTMTIDATGLFSGFTLTFDASAERSGDYVVEGGSHADTVVGGAGADSLNGNDGDDVLTGGKGGDMLSGGAGADTFVYLKITDSGQHKQFDLITDLDSSDHIDLSAIDANTTKAGNQAFHQVSAFTHHAGELVLSYDAGTGLTSLEVDVNGDGKADMTVHISGDQSAFAGLIL